MSIDHKRHAGDTLRPIRVTVLDEAQNPSRLRDPSDDTPPVVKLQIRLSGASAWHTPEKNCVVEEVTADLTTRGRIAYFPTTGDFDVHGVYETLFHFTWQGGETEHFPHEGFYLVEVFPS